MVRTNNIIATPPGETIKEQIQHKGLSMNDFSLSLKMDENETQNLVNGKIKITDEIAQRLESVLGVPCTFWLNLEKIYQDKIERIRKEGEQT